MFALYNYIFWNNPYEDVWYAIHRDSYLDFFNGNRHRAKFYKLKEHSTFVEIVSNPEKIDHLQ